MACEQDIRLYCERNGIREVPVCGMEELPLVLRGADGERYAEVDGNVWMPIGGRGDVAYVGTSRHGGHMTLRPLFVKLDGIWRNTVTGREPDFARKERPAGVSVAPFDEEQAWWNKVRR